MQKLKLVAPIVAIGAIFLISPILGLVITSTMVTLGVIGAIILPFGPLFKGLKDNPDEQRPFTLYVAVPPGRSVAVMKEGLVSRILHGKDRNERKTYEFKRKKDKVELFKNPLLHRYDMFVFRTYGVRFVGIPFVHRIKYKKLTRYNLVGNKEKNEKVFQLVSEGMSGFWTNHVRTRSTPWYFEWSGVDIEGIPFTVHGAVYYRIIEDKVEPALFNTSEWDEQLNLALNREGRGMFRSTMSIAKAIGVSNEDVWQAKERSAKTNYSKIGDDIMKAIKRYAFISPEEGTKQTLIDFGIDILHVDIIDFDDELEGEEKIALRAPSLARRKAQARSLEGKGERKYQEEVLNGLSSQPELAEIAARNDALVRASKEGSVVDTLVTIFAQNQQKKGK